MIERVHSIGAVRGLASVARGRSTGRRGRTLAATVVSLILVASCGGSDGSDGAAKPQESSTTAPGGSATTVVSAEDAPALGVEGEVEVEVVEQDAVAEEPAATTTAPAEEQTAAVALVEDVAADTGLSVGAEDSNEYVSVTAQNGAYSVDVPTRWSTVHFYGAGAGTYVDAPGTDYVAGDAGLVVYASDKPQTAVELHGRELPTAASQGGCSTTGETRPYVDERWTGSATTLTNCKQGSVVVLSLNPTGAANPYVFLIVHAVDDADLAALGRAASSVQLVA